MLDFMRKKAGSWMIKFILGAIIVVFVFWGVGSFSERDASGVATVNGEVIPLDTYRESYNALLEQVRQRFGGKLDDNLIKALNLPRQALDRLIDQTLWSQQARRLGIRISQEEVATAIASIPVFQSNGAFDQRRYEAVLSQNRMTVDQFETMQEQAMLVEKLRLFIAGGVMVSDDEARQWFDWNDTSMRIDYLVFQPEAFKDIETTPEEVKTYYDAHPDEYKSAERMKASYLRFSPDKYVAEVNISDDRVAQYYDTHREEFDQPPTVEARHILLTLEPTASPDEVDTKRLQAEELAKRARAGENFAELAKAYSEGPTRDSGGWLGAFKREDMVKPFSDAAFALKAGEVSDPVRTQFGWHVIEVEKVNEGGVRSLDEVRDEIRANLTDAEAKNLAYDEAVAVFDNTVDGEPLTAKAVDGDTPVQVTEVFDRQGPQGVANRSGFAEVAFKLEVLGVSDTVDLGDGYYIIQATEKFPPQRQPLAEVEARVRADLVKERQTKAAQEAAKEFLDGLKAGGSLEDQAAALGLEVASTDFFKRTGAIPGLGFERQISETAFTLSSENPVAGEAVKGAKGFYVIRLKEQKVPAAEAFEKEKASIKDELIRRKQMKTFEAWLAKNKADSDISIQEGFAQ